MPATDFQTLKAELDAMNRAYHSGAAVTYDALLEQAKATAAAFNAEAERIAKQFKRRPRYVTAASLLR